ncbi:hypothetical protein V5O48_013267 [Marasmius crinis-equi]|uniref:EamA domain-containing protein n=1 Tax=Marasmius crinis-equi TaxID=585013 RepID=A0ABR3F0J7_9AGAR
MSANDHPYNPLETNPSHATPTFPGCLRRVRITLMTPITQFFGDNCGLILVIVSQVLQAYINVVVKDLSTMDPPIPILEVILIRMGIAWIWIFYASDAFNSVESPFLGPKGVRLLLFLKGLGSFLAIFGLYCSLQWIPVFDATVLTFLTPLMAAVAGSIFLQEQFGKSQSIAVALGLLGLIFIARPAMVFGGDMSETVDVLGLGIELDERVPQAEGSVPDHRLLAVGMSLVGVLGSTIAAICLRLIGKRISPLHSLLATSSQSVIAAAIGMVATQTPFVIPSSWDLVFLLYNIGVLGRAAQLMLIKGFVKGKERAKMAVYTQIVWACAFEKLKFHTSPPLMSIVGMAVIIGAADYVIPSHIEEQTSPEEEGQKEPVRMVERSDDVVLEEGLFSGEKIRKGGDGGHENQ